MNAPLDHRTNPYRDDLAAAFLKDRIKAARYVEGEDMRIAIGLASLHDAPDSQTPAATQLLYGETFTVFDEGDDWAWGQNATDGYVGYLPAEVLSPQGNAATHSISVLRTFVYRRPDMKAPACDLLSMNARVTILDEEAGFARIDRDAWVFLPHLSPMDQHESDIAKTALSFLGTPYLWGGRSSLGLDCSALVQMSLLRAGMACPRDSDLQKSVLGSVVPADEPIQRGDIIFSPGHVAIAVDATHAVHANGHKMMVTVNPIAELFKPGLSIIRRLG
ncbi:MAG TPA: peptidase P60 [Rhodospirillaceae bacterium]|nr:MAG: hypothetical protein A2018_07100 [Alphaproteobacteria bacterium GWF2_58_20]HAU29241.1 peptidase P60 [Rhodospirillaceae bacterium]